MPGVQFDLEKPFLFCELLSSAEKSCWHLRATLALTLMGCKILLKASTVSQVKLLQQTDKPSGRNFPGPVLWGNFSTKFSFKLTCKFQPPGQCSAVFWTESVAGARVQTVQAPGLASKGSSRCWNHSAEPQMAWDLSSCFPPYACQLTGN